MNATLSFDAPDTPQLHNMRATQHGVEVLCHRRAGGHGPRHFEGKLKLTRLSSTRRPIAPHRILQRPLAPLFLAVGGIGGTALDQRQQYSACQALKKVQPALLRSMRRVTDTLVLRMSTSFAASLQLTSHPRPQAVDERYLHVLLQQLRRFFGRRASVAVRCSSISRHTRISRHSHSCICLNQCGNPIPPR